MVAKSLTHRLGDIIIPKFIFIFVATHSCDEQYFRV